MTYREIFEDDVGKPSITAFCAVWLVSGFIGRILPGDVGKRIYKRGNHLAVENDEQRDMRTKGRRR